MFALNIFFNDDSKLGAGFEYPELFGSVDAAKWFVFGLMQAPRHGIQVWMIVVQ